MAPFTAKNITGHHRRKAMKVARKVAVAFGIIILVGGIGLACLPTIAGAVIGLWDIPDKLNWRAHTSPLSQDVTDDLCLKFKLPSNDPLCQPGSRVYAPDFFNVIRATYQPKNGSWATYDEVQQKLGKYQFLYEPPVTTGNGFTYFVAHYDLKGDQVFPIVMFFYADGRLWRLIADVGD
jgi:hypothetical protein